jgi:hypothetical protein
LIQRHNLIHARSARVMNPDGRPRDAENGLIQRIDALHKQGHIQMFHKVSALVHALELIGVWHTLMRAARV